MQEQEPPDLHVLQSQSVDDYKGSEAAPVNENRENQVYVETHFVGAIVKCTDVRPHYAVP